MGIILYGMPVYTVCDDDPALSSFSSGVMWQTAFISCLSDLTCILPANLSLLEHLAMFQHSSGGGVQFNKDSNSCFFVLF